ncbi:MAG TPA: DUF6599 family protein [Pyrinomonadaceae bacterium]|nr:DUF6599 family protein [Pyrinomonadaceae bacterium]
MAVLAAVSFTLSATFVLADQPAPDVAKIFPANLGDFHHSGRISILNRESLVESLKLGNDSPNQVLQVFVAETEYASPDGEKFRVAVNNFENDSAAYSHFTFLRSGWRDRGGAPSGRVENIGTASELIPGPGLMFLKGTALVSVISEGGKSPDQTSELARLVAANLDNGEGDIPVLVKHLPNWEAAQRDVVYAVSQASLLDSIPNQPILKELTFEGGTEAVIARYGQSQLVIVEFTTPQFSVENDQRIWTKISELKSQGQPTPIAYRRVGNYSVFVFGAPDEKTANALVDQVRYEQVVQWLGDDPHMAERLTRYFRQTSAGVLFAVLKSSGLSLLICFGAGTLFGALLFRRRRAQQAAFYSDAGGSTRLNLDELTGENKSQRLLEPGKQPEADS